LEKTYTYSKSYNVEGYSNGLSGSTYSYYRRDHLGNNREVWRANDNATYQRTQYYPSGLPWAESINSGAQSRKYNGKEWIEMHGLDEYYSQARTLYPAIVRTPTMDPLCEKYYSISPYAWCGNNPVNVIDPDGREGIVVSGGEYNDPNRYKSNFIEPAITRLKELVEAGGSEPITWAVMTAGYSEKDISKFQSIAKDLGVNFQAIGSAGEFTNYLNSKSVSSSELSEARTGDQITSMTVFGHGFVGSAEFAYNQRVEAQSAFSWGIVNAKQLNAGAFNDAIINFYTCNAGTYNNEGMSLIKAVSTTTNSTVSGYWGKTDYAQINNGQGLENKWNRYMNGFNTNGSLFLPSAGTKSDGTRSILVTIYPANRWKKVK